MIFFSVFRKNCAIAIVQSCSSKYRLLEDTTGTEGDELYIHPDAGHPRDNDEEYYWRDGEWVKYER